MISKKRELVPHGPVSEGPPPAPPKNGSASSPGPTPKTKTPGMMCESAPMIRYRTV